MDRIVVVGASAGGVAALEQLVAGLPADFPAAILVALHLPEGYKSLLPRILTRSGALPAHDAVDGDLLRPGEIYVAVPDLHLLVDEDRVRLEQGPRENAFRPSIDVLFRSAASAWGSRAIGVVLSGALGDGASGLWAIKHVGGIAIVQLPQDAAYSSMPLQAMRRSEIDYSVPAAEIGPLLARLVRDPALVEPPHAADFRRELSIERDAVASDSGWKRRIMELKPTPYTCPSCHGVMFEIPEGDRRRFRCHTGHGYTIGALLPKLVEDSEDMLWNAVRAVEEAITLCREAAGDLRQNGEEAAAQALLDRARRANAKLELLRGLTFEDAGLLGEP